MTDYKIGEVARLLGLTTQALRFYEQEGVVTPKKSENGTRYYDEDQLILLLSFKKYRQADFSVQDIVTHFFKEDDLSGLRGQTLARRDMLLEQSALLRRRAEAFGAFEARLAYAQRPPGLSVLALAGPTHGGQVVLPVVGSIGRLTLGASLCWRGLCSVNGWPLFVTSGVGTSWLPISYGVPPEIVLLTLVPAEFTPPAGNPRR